MLYQLSYVRVLPILAAPGSWRTRTPAQVFPHPGVSLPESKPSIRGRSCGLAYRAGGLLHRLKASRPHRQDAATLSGAGSSF